MSWRPSGSPLVCEAFWAFFSRLPITWHQVFCDLSCSLWPERIGRRKVFVPGLDSVWRSRGTRIGSGRSRDRAVPRLFPPFLFSLHFLPLFPGPGDPFFLGNLFGYRLGSGRAALFEMGWGCISFFFPSILFRTILVIVSAEESGKISPPPSFRAPDAGCPFLGRTILYFTESGSSPPLS